MIQNCLAVICSWNKTAELIECVHSVLASSYPQFSIVVVDNGSNPDVLEEIKKRLPDSVKLIENKENLGGAGGFNTGMQYGLDQGCFDAIWLLDNDVVVDKDCLKELINALNGCKEAAVAGSMILLYDRPDTLQELGAFTNLTTFQDSPHLQYAQEKSVPLEIIEVDYVPACSLLVRCSALKHAGLMDAEFFLYYDDKEWCYRFKNKGYKILATPFSKVWHHFGSSKKTNNIPTYYEWRNKTYFIKSNLDKENFINHFILDKAFTALFMSYHTNKTNAFSAIALAIMDAFCNKRGKIEESRIFPLDENSFQKVNHIQKLLVIGEGDKSLIILEKFLQYHDFPEHIFLQDAIENHLYDRDVLIICNHLLSVEPNLDVLLSKVKGRVFYIDHFLNFVEGKERMRSIRESYHSLKARLTPIIKSLL